MNHAYLCHDCGSTEARVEQEVTVSWVLGEGPVTKEDGDLAVQGEPTSELQSDVYEVLCNQCLGPMWLTEGVTEAREGEDPDEEARSG